MKAKDLKKKEKEEKPGIHWGHKVLIPLSTKISGNCINIPIIHDNWQDILNDFPDNQKARENIGTLSS